MGGGAMEKKQNNSGNDVTCDTLVMMWHMTHCSPAAAATNAALYSPALLKHLPSGSA